MLQSFEIKEAIDERDCIIWNLKKLLLWLVSERMGIAEDSPEREKMLKIISKIDYTSKYKGPDGEEYISWDENGVIGDMKDLWKYFHKK